MLSLTHHLYLDTLGADIVENQLGTRSALSVDTTSNPDGHFRLLFTLLKTLVFLQVFSQILGDLEFVGVGIRLLSFAEFLDSIGSDFVVLLMSRIY